MLIAKLDIGFCPNLVSHIRLVHDVKIFNCLNLVQLPESKVIPAHKLWFHLYLLEIEESVNCWLRSLILSISLFTVFAICYLRISVLLNLMLRVDLVCRNPKSEIGRTGGWAPENGSRDIAKTKKIILYLSNS